MRASSSKARGKTGTAFIEHAQVWLLPFVSLGR